MSSGREQEILDIKTHAGNGWDQHKGTFGDLERVFNAEYTDQEKEYFKENEMSSIFFNKAQGKCNTLTLNLTKTYFANDKFASIEAVESSEEQIKVATAIEKDVKAELNKADLFGAIHANFVQLPYRGTMVTRSFWNNGFNIEKVDLEKFWFDREAKTQDINYCVHEIESTVADVKRLQRAGHFTRRINIDETISDKELGGLTTVTLHEVYIKLDGVWKVSTILNDVDFLRTDFILADGLPFNWGGLEPQTKDLNEENHIANYYKPFITKLLALQDEYNARRNQIIDGVKQQLNPKMIVPKNKGLNQKEIKSPTGNIHYTSPTAIQVIPPANTQGAMQDVILIAQEMNEFTQMPDVLSGGDAQNNKTKYQVGVETTSGGLKLDVDARVLNSTFFEGVLERAAALCWKYSTNDSFYHGINRAEVVPNVKVTFNTGLGVNNDMLKGERVDSAYMKLSDLFEKQIAVGDQEGAKQSLVGMNKLVRESIALSGIKNPDEYMGEEQKLGEDDDDTK